MQNKKKAKEVKKLIKKNKDKIKQTAFLHKPRARYGIELGGYTYDDWLDLVNKHGNKCYYCGVELTKIPHKKNTLTRDHVIPLSNGGTDKLDNIVPACNSCNGRKSTKTVDEWKV
jgi:5-methylcytosine-specific restriction endonuclease McrA